MLEQKTNRSIFLSHNRVDKPFVRRVNQELKKIGIRTWMDEAEILPGDSLPDKIAIALREMDYLGAFAAYVRTGRAPEENGITVLLGLAH